MRNGCGGVTKKKWSENRAKNVSRKQIGKGIVKEIQFFFRKSLRNFIKNKRR